VLTRNVDPTLPRMVMLLTDGNPTARFRWGSNRGPHCALYAAAGVCRAACTRVARNCAFRQCSIVGIAVAAYDVQDAGVCPTQHKHLPFKCCNVCDHSCRWTQNGTVSGIACNSQTGSGCPYGSSTPRQCCSGNFCRCRDTSSNCECDKSAAELRGTTEVR
jgi:hypothetical protein